MTDDGTDVVRMPAGGDDAVRADELRTYGGTALLVAVAGIAQAGSRAEWSGLPPWYRSAVERLEPRIAAAPPGVVVALTRMAVRGGRLTRAPRWLCSVASRGEWEQLGAAVAAPWPPDASDSAPDPTVEGGLRRLAVAVCRNLDTARDLVDVLPDERRQVFWNAVRVAAVAAPEGMPSAVRRAIRTWWEGQDHG